MSRLSSSAESGLSRAQGGDVQAGERLLGRTGSCTRTDVKTPGSIPMAHRLPPHPGYLPRQQQLLFSRWEIGHQAGKAACLASPGAPRAELVFPHPHPFIYHLWCQAGKSGFGGLLVGQMGSQPSPFHPGFPVPSVAGGSRGSNTGESLGQCQRATQATRTRNRPSQKLLPLSRVRALPPHPPP